MLLFIISNTISSPAENHRLCAGLQTNKMSLEILDMSIKCLLYPVSGLLMENGIVTDQEKYSTQEDALHGNDKLFSD